MSISLICQDKITITIDTHVWKKISYSSHTNFDEISITSLELNMTSDILKAVLEFQESGKVSDDIKILIPLIIAANYLEYKELLDTCLRIMVSKIKPRTLQDINFEE